VGEKQQPPVQADPPSPPEPEIETETEIPIGESEWVQRGGRPDVDTRRG